MECVDTFIRFAITLPILSIVSGALLLIDLLLPDPFILTRSPFVQILLIAAFTLSALIANLIAPRMRIRSWGKEGWKRGDRLSG